MERSAPEAGLCLDNKVRGHWKQDKAAIRMLMVREKWRGGRGECLRVCKRVVQEQSRMGENHRRDPAATAPLRPQPNQHSPVQDIREAEKTGHGGKPGDFRLTDTQ